MTQRAHLPTFGRLPPQTWRELGGLSLMLMEVTWAAAWYQAIVKPLAPLIITAIVFSAIILGSNFISRFIGRDAMNTNLSRAMIFAWLAFCVFFSLQVLVFPGQGLSLVELIGSTFSILGLDKEGMRQFWHLLFVSLLFLRGVVLARRPLSLGYNISSFTFGIIAFMIYGMAYQWMQASEPITALLLFLFIGLIGMSTSRIALLGETKGGKLPVFGRSWFTRILLAALAGSAGALAVGWLLSGHVAAYMAALVAVLFSLLAVAFYTLLLPILGLLIDLAYRIGQFAFQDFELKQSPAMLSMEEFMNTAEENIEAMNDAANTSQFIILGGILILILIAIWFSFNSKSWQKRELNEVEEGETRSSPRLSSTADEKSPTFPFTNPFRWIAAARIRRIYSQLMDMSRKLDLPRPAAVTPLEFQPRLLALFPDAQEQVVTITTAYLKIRYGELPESNQDVDTVTDAWTVINNQGRKMLAQKRMEKRLRPKR
jgi:hypothetical protein